MNVDLFALARGVHDRLDAHRDAFDVTWRAPRPITEAALAATEKKLGMRLPEPLRALYTRHAAGLLLSWRMKRGEEERLGGDLHDPVGGHLDIVAPSALARRLKEHGVVQITSDGGGNGYALRPGDPRQEVHWFDHDPADGEHVRRCGEPFERWFAGWSKSGFGSADGDNARVAKFFAKGTIGAKEAEAKPSRASPKRGGVVEAPKHKEQVWAVTVLADGKRGASADNGGTIHVFDLETGARLFELAAIARVYALAAPKNGDVLVSAGEQGFQVWNLRTKKPTRASRKDVFRVLDAALTADDRLVTAGLGELALWELRTGKRLASVEDDGSSVRVDGRGRAITYEERSIRVWDLARKRRERVIEHPKMPEAITARSLAVDPRTDTIILVDAKPSIARWTSSGKCITPPKKGRYALGSPCLTPDGKTLLMPGATANATLDVWDVASGSKTRSLSLDGRVGVASIAVTPDGKRAVLGSVYGWVVVVDLPSS